MAQVISATTRKAAKGGLGFARYRRFIEQSDIALREAQAQAREGRWDMALENAYQSALRTAGAAIATSSVIARRKRLPSSAWDRLELVGESEKVWAGTFRDYSRLRSRALSGLERDLDPAVVGDVIRLASEFLADIEGVADGQLAAA